MAQLLEVKLIHMALRTSVHPVYVDIRPEVRTDETAGVCARKEKLVLAAVYEPLPPVFG